MMRLVCCFLLTVCWAGNLSSLPADIEQPKLTEDEAFQILFKSGAKVEKFGETRLPKGKDKPFLSATFSNAKLTGDDLAPLRAFDLPIRMSFGNNNTTDADLEKLGQYDRIEELTLFFVPRVTDVGFAKLGKLKNLKVLKSSATRINGEGFAGFRETKLESLKFGARLSPDGARALADIATLKVVDLGSPSLTDNAVEPLQKLRAVETLRLAHTKVTSAGVIHLAGVQSLKSLDLQYTSVDSLGVVALSTLSSLENLNLYNTPFDDAGMFALVRMKKLTTLNISRTRVTDVGLAHLRNMKLTSLRAELPEMTDKGLAHLQEIKALKSLMIARNSNVSREAIERLKAALPEMKFSVTPIK